MPEAIASVWRHRVSHLSQREWRAVSLLTWCSLGECTCRNERSNKSSAAKRADRYLAGAALRAGSKQSLVVEMLSKHQGTTLDALVKATGWLPHTTRAALTGLGKRGFAIERIRNETKGSSLYRIANGPNAAAGA